MQIEDPGKVRTNWTGAEQTRPRKVVVPDSVDELVAIVREPQNYPSPVRAAGHLHSTNPCFSTNLMGDHEDRRGTLVLMRPAFGRVDDVSGPEFYVTARAGARLIDIRNTLRPLGRELAVSPEIGNATAGSVACGGTKDSTLRPRTTVDQSQLSSLVVEAKLVDAAGNKLRVHGGGVEVLEGTGTPPPWLNLGFLRSSYGLVGIIYEVTFRTVPRVPIRTRYEWIPIVGSPVRERPTPEQIPDLDARVFAGADGILGFLQPYAGGLLVERRTQAPDAKIGTTDRTRRALRDWMWKWGASESVTAGDCLAELVAGDPAPAFKKLLAAAIEAAVAGTVDDPLTQGLLGTEPPTAETVTRALRQLLGIGGIAGTVTDYAGWAISWFSKKSAGLVDRADLRRQIFALLDLAPGPLFTTLGGFAGYRSDSMFEFPESRGTHFDFTFWTFPLDSWRSTISAYFAFCDTFLKGPRQFRPSLFTQVYAIGRDRSSMLSPSPNGPVFTLDVAHGGPHDEGWRWFNESYNQWAVAQGGRPLLNQTKQLETTPDAAGLLGTAFHPDWPTFSSRVWEANPAVADAGNGRFVSDFFARLLDPPSPPRP